MKVVLLGAGASKSYVDSPTKVRMPVAKEFFSTYFKLAISENGWVLVGYLINYLQKFKYIKKPTDFLNFEKDIEQVHTEIEEKLFSIINDPSDLNEEQFTNLHLFFKAYTQLIFLFANVLNEIQNGPVSTSHIELVKHLTSEDAIITFNWDTLMDKALHSCTDWNCQTGYFVKPVAVYNDGWEINTATPCLSAPQLLKLHGSTNWLTTAPILEGKSMKSIQELSNENFFIYQSSSKPYSTYDGRYMSGYNEFSYGYYPVNIPLQGIPLPDGYLLTRSILRNGLNPKGEAEDIGLNSIPLIIPPVHNKNYDYYNGLFESLWNQAEAALTMAEEIIIIGYSFPRTDYKSDKLFKQAFIRRTTIPKITVLDPFPEAVADRFKLDYGIPDNCLEVIKEYFTDKFDFKRIFK